MNYTEIIIMCLAILIVLVATHVVMELIETVLWIGKVGLSKFSDTSKKLVVACVQFWTQYGPTITSKLLRFIQIFKSYKNKKGG